MAAEPEKNPFISVTDAAYLDANAPKDSQSNTPSLASSQGLLKPRRSVLSIGLFVISVYSTILSGVFLVVATIKPRYGLIISSRGPFSPSATALLTAFLAKTIEISFVMVFLAFLGQVLSRRAARQQGINLSSVAMRSWILQPGTLFTQWHTVRYAGLSVIGVLSLTAAVLTLLYTTAAGAIVQPLLLLPPWEQRVLMGEVQTDFSNSVKARDTCLGNWPDMGDQEYGGSTCVELQWTSLCYRNFQRYMTKWSNATAQDTPLHLSGRLDDRPIISPALDDNITVTTSWLDKHDIRSDSARIGRIINNVTIAVPHRGIPAAARDSRNGLLQPEDLQNSGSYAIDASVASFALNALCVNANRTELEPIVYETWPNAQRFENSSEALSFWSSVGAETNNHTVLDDVFGWRDDSEGFTHARALFFKFPLPGNTIANHTSMHWGKSEVYVLGKHPENITEDYFLCSLKAGITTSCTTRYNASSTGQSLEALCGKEAGHQDGTANPSVSGDFYEIPGWRDFGFDLLNAMSLNTGAIDGNAALPRVLTQLQLRQPELNANLPSPAEALLSMATCTVLDLTKNFPFQPLWNYPLPDLDEPQLQYFNASVRVAQYMSGGEHNYQRAFLIILLLTFAINAFILVYLGILLRVRLITDLCEPLVLFILGYHSMPNGLFQGVPHDGLKHSDFSVPWIVKRDDGQLVVVGKDEADLSAGREDGKQSFLMRSRKRAATFVRRRSDEE